VVQSSATSFGLLLVGTAVSQAITLSTSGDDGNFTRVRVGNAGPDSNGIGLAGGTNPVFNASSVTDQRTLGGTFNTVGTIYGSIDLPTTGEGLSGEVPLNVPVDYVAQVYSGKAEWIAATGPWATSSNWKDTAGGGLSGAPGLSGDAADTATFGSAAPSGTADVALNGVAPVLSNLIFNNPNASYRIQHGTGNSGLTLTGTAGNSPAAVTVVSGKHFVDLPILLDSDLVVSGSGGLTVSGSISDGGAARSLRLDGGELTLTGAGSYTGGTTVDKGTLILGAETAIADGTSLTVGTGATSIFGSSASGSPAGSSAVAVAVPEPSTFVLLGMCAAGLLGWAWRRGRRVSRVP
jgi:autotransporter-associated beta strand protein